MEGDVIMPPVHPGEILLTEFLEPLELSQYQLARSIGPNRERRQGGDHPCIRPIR
jgi:plasmid maintenance system antidote protein VapI